MEERSIIINKLFNFDQIDQFLEEHNFLQKEDSIQSDLKYYLGAWLLPNILTFHTKFVTMWNSFKEVC